MKEKPDAMTSEQRKRRYKIRGLGLISLGLALFVFMASGLGRVGFGSLLGWVWLSYVLSIFGLADFARSKGRTGGWALLAAFPVVGLILGLAILAVLPEIEALTESRNLTVSIFEGLAACALVLIVVSVSVLFILLADNWSHHSGPEHEQREAKTNLGSIFTNMVAYSAESPDGYAGATLENIGFSTTGTTRYRYTLENVSTSTFLAKAVGIRGSVVGDVWTIDETRNLMDVDPSSTNH
ncbi:MAG: hypothetical protein ACE5HN_03110 [Nitrospiria bacterium]